MTNAYEDTQKLISTVSAAIRDSLDNMGAELTWDQCDAAAISAIDALQQKGKL